VADGPRAAPASIISRLPVRYTYDNRYFNDTTRACPPTATPPGWSGWPTTHNIDVRLDTDFFDDSQEINRDNVRGNVPVVYTGPVDRYFDYSEGELGWRTIDLEEEVLPDRGLPGHLGDELPRRRRAVHPHPRVPALPPRARLHQGRDVIMREYSRFAGRDDEPYYPINTDADRDGLLKYRDQAKAEPNVLFGGRLGTYKYLDMHMAIGSALSMFDNKIKPHFAEGVALESGGVDA
jgi:UDP-galactopyranose mutase